VLSALLLSLDTAGYLEWAWIAAVLLGALGLARMVLDCAGAMAIALRVLEANGD
jgi:hypothetical protein